MLYKYKNRIRPPPPTVEEGAEGEETEEVKDEVFPDDQEIPTVPYRKLEPTASEFVINNEGIFKSNLTFLQRLCVTDKKHCNDDFKQSFSIRLHLSKIHLL